MGLQARLLGLQRIDSGLTRAIAHREALDDGSAARGRVLEASTSLEETRHRLTSGHSRQKVLELEIQSLYAKRRKIEADMYSGRIGNPKELSAMQDDVASLGRHADHLEGEVLELLEQAEHIGVEHQEAEQRLAQAQADLARILEEFRLSSVAIDEEIASLTAARQENAADIGEDLLRRYERLREKKGGLAVVAVRGGVCEGCHVTVPDRLLSRLERDEELVATCDGCGRLLTVQPEG